jgi:hypothetical protein
MLKVSSTLIKASISLLIIKEYTDSIIREVLEALRALGTLESPLIRLGEEEY